LPDKLREGLRNLGKAKVDGLGDVLAPLAAAVEEFAQAADAFMGDLNDVDTSNELKLRVINDQLMQLERVWVMPGGVPGRPEVRHAIFAPAKFNKYGQSIFPGLLDLIHGIQKLEGQELEDRWKQIKRHASDLMIMTRNAADFLLPTWDI